MNRFRFILYFAFIASFLLVGCMAPTYLMNAPKQSPEKEIDQALESWNEMHISQAIQKWGSPHEMMGGEVGPKIYVWQMIVQTPLLRQAYQDLSSEHVKGRSSLPDAFSSSNVLYELVFYTRPNGIIHKSDARRYQMPIDESYWKRKHISRAIQEWGNPHGRTEDEAGSKIYIWRTPTVEFLPAESGAIASGQQATVLHNIAGTSAATSETCEIMFYTHRNGVIYKMLIKKG